MRGVAHSIWIGFDPREVDGFAVTRSSVRRHCNMPIPIRGLVLSELRKAGLFWRQQESRNGQIWDVISEAPCATEFSISRFLVGHLAKGLVMFLDSDMLVLGDVWKLFDEVERQRGKAIYCVKHDYRPTETVKMDGQSQSQYGRKNWSSMFILDADHASNKKLTLEMVNTLPGRELHQFCWLADDEIGELGAEWNYLVGHTAGVDAPKIVHFTSGIPSMLGYESVEYADEWRSELNRWAA